MGVITNIYSILAKDSQNIYFKNNILSTQLNPIDIITDSTFDSTVGDIEDKNTIISILNTNKLENIKVDDILYSNDLIMSINYIYNDYISCKILYNYNSQDPYNLKNKILYKLNDFYDYIAESFKYSNRIKYLSSLESIKYLENNNIWGFIKEDVTASIDSTSIKIKILNISNANLATILKSLYFNIYPYSFDIISNFFNVRNINERELFIGSIYDYTNLFLDINPPYKIRLHDFPVEITINLINKGTQYEKAFELTDKVILIFNFSLNDISDQDAIFNIKSGYFYRIIS